MVYAQGQKTYTLMQYTDGLLTKDLRKSRIHEERIRDIYVYTASVIQPGFRRRSKAFPKVEDALTWLHTALPLVKATSSPKSRSKVFNASDHRSIILSVAGAPIRKTAHKRAHMILSQTGSFTRAISDEDLVSREAFARAFTDEVSKVQKALRAARNSKKVKVHQTSSAPSEGNPSVWGSFEPSSAEAKPSLRISIPNDAPEDVAAEVLADLSCQKSPCGDCGRLFELQAFFAVADRLAKTEEQKTALRNLRSLADANRLTKACPMLFHALGIPPHGKHKSGARKGQYILPQEGPLAPDADAYHCRMHQLAGHYCWRAAMRYACRAARGGAFREGLRQDADGNDIAEYAEDDRPVWTSAEDAQRTPEQVLLEKVRSDVYLSYMTIRIRMSSDRKDYSMRLERTLRMIARTGTWPSGSDVADLLDVSPRTGRNILSDLSDIIRDADADVRAVAV